MILSINNKNIEEKIKQYNWRGEGTKEKPYVIEGLLTVSQIRLKNINFCIEINDCNGRMISLKNCSEINIKNCKFKVISLIKCHNLEIQKSNFKQFNKLYLCSFILIKNTICGRVVPYYCQALTIIDNEIQILSLKGLDGNLIMRNLLIFAHLVILISLIVSILILTIESFIFLVIIETLTYLAFFFPILLDNKFNKKEFLKLKNLPKNKIENNIKFLDGTDGN